MNEPIHWLLASVVVLATVLYCHESDAEWIEDYPWAWWTLFVVSIASFGISGGMAISDGLIK